MRPYVFRTPCEIELLVPIGAVISMEGFGELSSNMQSDGQIDMSMGIVVDMFVCTSMATDIDFLMGSTCIVPRYVDKNLFRGC
jgi:hypothetical protein